MGCNNAYFVVLWFCCLCALCKKINTTHGTQTAGSISVQCSKFWSPMVFILNFKIESIVSSCHLLVIALRFPYYGMYLLYITYN
jgi:hypothetical protein